MINSKNTILKHYKEHCDHNRSAETITLCSTTVLDQIVQAHLMVEKKKTMLHKAKFKLQIEYDLDDK